MNRETMARLNLVFALLLFLLGLALMIFGDNKTVGIALFPVAFANLTIGIVGLKKEDS